MKLTALIEREGEGYVSLCPELDVASQGKTVRSPQARRPRRNAEETSSCGCVCDRRSERHWFLAGC